MSGVKQALFEQLARIGKVLGQANRLELLDYLAQCPYNVETLSKLSGLSVANTSQHLKQLKLAGLVEAKKFKQHVFYQMTGEDIVHLIDAMRTVAQNHLAEVNQLIQQNLDTLDPIEAITAEQLEQRISSGQAKVIDVRPLAEFTAGHIQDAAHIPVEQLAESIDKLKGYNEIIAYCRGPYCIYSYEAVTVLRKAGINIRRFEAGFPEWKAQGRAITATDKSGECHVHH